MKVNRNQKSTIAGDIEVGEVFLHEAMTCLRVDLAECDIVSEADAEGTVYAVDLADGVVFTLHAYRTVTAVHSEVNISG
jgi:hypothetical protein